MGENATNSSFESIRSKIESDPKYKRTLEILREMSILDVNELHNEILGYQAERAKRPLLAFKRGSTRAIIKYASEDAGYRSRITYVRTLAKREVNKIEHLSGIFHDWVMAEHLRGVKATVQEKGALVSVLATRMYDRISKLNSLDECCLLCLEDVDQSQWQRKAIVSALEIESRPEGKV
jgi:hypothetical protein